MLAACASRPRVPPPLVTDKEFQVPAKLADQFAVREKGGETPSAAAKEQPIPIAPEEPGKMGKQKKKEKAKKEEKALKIPAKAAGPAEIPNRWTMTPFFRVGERAVFDITYFGATAGQLELEVLPEKRVSERPTYHFRAMASSTSIFSLFYRVNDVAESFMDTEGLFSHKFSIKLDESKQNRDVLELYDQKKRKAYYWSKLVTPDKKQNEQSEKIGRAHV